MNIVLICIDNFIDCYHPDPCFSSANTDLQLQPHLRLITSFLQHLTIKVKIFYNRQQICTCFLQCCSSVMYCLIRSGQIEEDCICIILNWKSVSKKITVMNLSSEIKSLSKCAYARDNDDLG